MQTIPQLFANAVARFGAYPALSEPGANNQVATISYLELQERVQRFAGSLQHQGFAKGERLLIWSASRIDWMVAYLAALSVGLVIVPLDINTKEDFLQRLAATTEARCLITTQKQYQSLHHPSVPMIDIDHLPEDIFEAEHVTEIHENDLAELVFTSGTTGQPKGVMLSHRNIVSNAVAALEVVKLSSKDCALSILPLSHMFELTIEMAILHTGASIVYARTLSPETLFKLLATQHVTCSVLVPQALQLFLNGVEREVRRQKKERQWEILQRIAAVLPFGVRRYLFGTVHRRFGSHFRLFVSGGAYLAPQLGYSWENMGFRVLPGYGATECAPVISAATHHDHHMETVGKPLPGVEVKIADDGEILVRGPNVALGYWKNPEATQAVFRDGWYYTGDLGFIDARGNLTLKGRKKNLIVLANGLNVYPEDVENVLLNQSGVKDAIVCAVPNKDREPEVHAILLMDDSGKARDAVRTANKQLASHQQIKGFTLWRGEDFPRTHTLKVKRPEVLAALEKMRAEQKEA